MQKTTKTKAPTPAQLGYRMPAEWEPHRGTWLSWPHNPETWPADVLPRVQKVWAQMAKHLSDGEEVHINVADQAMAESALKLLKVAKAKLKNIFFHYFPTNDAWVRDHGPIFVVRNVDEQAVILDWDYNAWGGKYPPFDKDNLIPRQVADYFETPRYVPGMILEGGSIEVNGVGTLLTSEACLLNRNRNPHRTKAEIETRLKDCLGVRQILWVKDGILGDDTDGHIDDIARFVNTDAIVCVRESDSSDPNYPILEDNYERLQKFRDPQGEPFRILSLPMPKPVEFRGERLPASYANFYIGNDVVLVPIFKDPQDKVALDLLASLFRRRRVIGIDCREVIIGLGAIHCVTQQWPKA